MNSNSAPRKSHLLGVLRNFVKTIEPTNVIIFNLLYMYQKLRTSGILSCAVFSSDLIALLYFLYNLSLLWHYWRRKNVFVARTAMFPLTFILFVYRLPSNGFLQQLKFTLHTDICCCRGWNSDLTRGLLQLNLPLTLCLQRSLVKYAG